MTNNYPSCVAMVGADGRQGVSQLEALGERVFAVAAMPLGSATILDNVTDQARPLSSKSLCRNTRSHLIEFP